MSERLRVILTPPAVITQGSTGLTFTDILFGLVISELFLRLQKWLVLPWYIRWHLVVGAALVLGSWIGFRRSVHRTKYELKFFNLPLFRFLADQLMVLFYFRVAVLTALDGTNPPPAVSLAQTTSTLLVYVFLLYVIWDLLGVWMSVAPLLGARIGKKPRYPKVDDDRGGMMDQREQPNWSGLTISTVVLLCFVALAWVIRSERPTESQAAWLLGVAVALLLMYRLLKEIRTSWQSL
jgi:hypothetical protein